MLAVPCFSCLGGNVNGENPNLAVLSSLMRNARTEKTKKNYYTTLTSGTNDMTFECL